ncbi:uncharacterized protein [Acropora muricata]|uniref:uncharacterized protein isoform X3 n=1 Tax=Acropora muricata TaxID=159855 RepID=UPI0034E46AE7
MASRVSPKESCVVDIYDNGSSFSVKHIPDGESAIEPFQNENNTREQLLQAIGKPNSNSLGIAVLRKRHHDLCQVVEMADRVHSPLILEMVAFSFPVICFNFYVVINSDAFQEQLTLVVNTLFWLLISSATTGVIMIVGAKVSEKIHAVEKIFQTFPVPPEDEGKLLIFMMDLQGEPKGLSVGGLSVITKTLSLTVVGIIVSYGAVMLSLPARF